MAREMGWTLEYVDGLSLAEWHRYWQILDGESRAAAHRNKQAQQRAANAGKRRRR